MKNSLLIATVMMAIMGGTMLSFTSKPAGHKSYQIYLLLGQSNMAGRGPLTPEYRALHDSRVMMLNKENNWVEARHPLHFDKPKVAGVGPGLSFGQLLAEAYPKDTIGLVPCAVGGTSIAKWEPGAFDKSTSTHPYDDALIRIKEAMKKGTIKGVIWLQGEADTKPEALSTYLSKLKVLIERLRKETGNPKLAFVAGELGSYREVYKPFNAELAKLPSLVKYTAVASSEGYTHKGDTTHFDAASAIDYGKRFGMEMIKLQKGKRN